MQKNTIKIIGTAFYVHYWFIGMCVVSPLDISASQLFFNSLFPTTWYEKSLNTTIFVWHKVTDFLQEDQDVLPEVFDRLIDRCAFAYFCLEKMIQNKQMVIEEDILYLTSLLHKLENRLMGDNTHHIKHEQVELLKHIIIAMQQSLELPRNI